MKVHRCQAIGFQPIPDVVFATLTINGLLKVVSDSPIVILIL